MECVFQHTAKILNLSKNIPFFFFFSIYALYDIFFCHFHASLVFNLPFLDIKSEELVFCCLAAHRFPPRSHKWSQSKCIYTSSLQQPLVGAL